MVPCPAVASPPQARELRHDGHFHPARVVCTTCATADPHTPAAVRTPMPRRWLPRGQYVAALSNAIPALCSIPLFHKVLRDGACSLRMNPSTLLTAGHGAMATPTRPADRHHVAQARCGRSGRSLSDPIDVASARHLLEKMSKSSPTRVDPAVVLDRYGADTRPGVSSCFKAPPKRSGVWMTLDVEGKVRAPASDCGGCVGNCCNPRLRLPSTPGAAATAAPRPEKELRGRPRRIAAIDDDLCPGP